MGRERETDRHKKDIDMERKAEKELGIDGLTDIERDTVREIDR